ncbi:Protein of unknown function [Salegentibacter echinorum]|uniref:DUF3050 domain-containing protein n=1 Tax=Salegentibacter echinorum TaxID=1073325 RepID=A0A1M5HN00_SALEC|nr:DUF3050 domain-containing protein [Salegentibacter echinorum]SHG17278.1 Protein of unknown function [Salegentibacter echinorum]
MINEIERELQPTITGLQEHNLYQQIQTPEDLQIFMQHQVFAVWDFMSLLKALQKKLTKTSTPWVPVGDPEIRYLLNGIVLSEESDMDCFGKRQSHFEMYLNAMEQIGANTEEIKNFLLQVTHGTDIFLLIAALKLPHNIKIFLRNTFETITEGRTHKIAAAFTFGREGPNARALLAAVDRIQKKFPKKDFKLTRYIFERRIQLMQQEQGPMAFKILEQLCRNDEQKWDEVRETAKDCLETRLVLWNGIEEKILENKNSSNLKLI